MGSSTGFCFLSLLRICTWEFRLCMNRGQKCAARLPLRVSLLGEQGVQGMVWFGVFFLNTWQERLYGGNTTLGEKPSFCQGLCDVGAPGLVSLLVFWTVTLFAGAENECDTSQSGSKMSCFSFSFFFSRLYLPGKIPNCHSKINIPNWGSFQATAHPSLSWQKELYLFHVLNKSSYFPSFPKDSN